MYIYVNIILDHIGVHAVLNENGSHQKLNLAHGFMILYDLHVLHVSISLIRGDDWKSAKHNIKSQPEELKAPPALQAGRCREKR